MNESASDITIQSIWSGKVCKRNNDVKRLNYYVLHFKRISDKYSIKRRYWYQRFSTNAKFIYMQIECNAEQQ